MSSTSLNLMICESYSLISDKSYMSYEYNINITVSCTLVNKSFFSVRGRNFLTD
jgi:hypothetical protein